MKKSRDDKNFHYTPVADLLRAVSAITMKHLGIMPFIPYLKKSLKKHVLNFEAKGQRSANLWLSWCISVLIKYTLTYLQKILPFMYTYTWRWGKTVRVFKDKKECSPTEVNVFLIFRVSCFVYAVCYYRVVIFCCLRTCSPNHIDQSTSLVSEIIN